MNLNYIYHITRARKNYANYTQTPHLTLHSADFPNVAKCIVCASNYTQTIHKPYTKLYTEPYTEAEMNVALCRVQSVVV